MTELEIKYERLSEVCKEWNIPLSLQQLEQFETYYQILIRENEVMNLTAITEFQDVLEKHFIDSICLAKHHDFSKVRSLIDVGTGAGFPGIPLKIIFPEIEIALLDSLNKRIGFLNQVIEALGLKKISAHHGRAEDYGRNKEFREKYDLCVSRAVANLSSLSEYCIPFVKVGGYFIPYKSGTIDEELEAAKHAVHLLGASMDHVDRFTLPGSDIERTFLFIEKKRNTAKTYPRKAGTPSKNPLK